MRHEHFEELCAAASIGQATAEELAKDLDRFREGKPIKARPTPSWEHGLKWAKRRPVAAMFLALGLVAFFGLTAGVIVYQRQARVRLEKRIAWVDQQHSQGLVLLDEATGKLVQVMQQNNGLQPLSKPQAISVGGIEGRSIMLQSPSPFPNENGQPQQERDWLITVPQRDGALIFMIFVAPEVDFAHLQTTYQAMLKSMQFR